MLEETRTKAAMITMGAEGLVAFEPIPETHADRTTDRDDPFRSRVSGEHVPALSSHAIDPLGCGDALVTTATLTPAAILGAAAAATHGQRLGNPGLEPSDIRRTLLRIAGARLAYTGAEIKPVAKTERQAS